jgi:CRP/FNR family cyclic AMP-dependent transcriptional regulator
MSRATSLQNAPIFTELPAANLSLLEASLKRRIFRDGEVIFRQGDPGHCLYIIESGRVRIYVLGPDGREISVNIYASGDVFGELALLDGLPRSASAVALLRTETLALYRDDFLEHLRAFPEIANNLIFILSTRLRHTTNYAESLAFLDVRTRLARELLLLAERYGIATKNGVEIDLGMTQADLASLIGTSRETLNRTLNRLRDENVIKVVGRKVELLDAEKLHDIAGLWKV